MDQKKSNVVKSKSSNSASPTKSERVVGKNKKTCSNVEVQPTVVKKRGVYVEKKPYKMGRLSPGKLTKKFDSPNQTRPESPNHGSPPPRRDRKKFLSSVLTILSQNTTSTQYPEEIEKRNRRPTSKDVVKKTSGQTTRRRLGSPIPSMLNQKQEAKKPKYKSRTLNNNPNEIDQFIVWKKSNTKPSAESASSMSSSKLRIRCDDENDCCSPIGKLIGEGKKLRSTKMQQRMDLEPDTLVSQSKIKDDKSGIYDFFVDLLETTLNVYNVNAEVDIQANQSKESDVKLEIDETVAEKLNDIANNLTNKHSKIFRIADDYSPETKTFMNSVMNSPERSEKIDLADDYMQMRDLKSPSRNFRSCMRPRMSMSPTEFRTTRSPAAKSRASKSPGRSIYSQSFSYPDKYKSNAPKAQSVVMSNASKKKQKKRKTLLGMLKEELSFNDYVYDEPQNLFEALRIVARNKRRSKTIQFADNMTPDDDFIRSDCMKRKKLIPTSLKSRKSKRGNDLNQTYGVSNNFNRSSSFYKSKSESEYLGDTESHQSLEVYDLDYDYYEPGNQSPSPVKLRPKKTRKRLVKKTIVYTAPSDSSTDVGYVREDEDNDGTIRKFAETIVSTIDHRKANDDNVSNMVSRFIVD